jgi:hypothetical protein
MLEDPKVNSHSDIYVYLVFKTLVSQHSVVSGLHVDDSVRNAFVQEMTDLKSVVVNERRAGMKTRRKECLDAFTAATQTFSA